MSKVKEDELKQEIFADYKQALSVLKPNGLPPSRPVEIEGGQENSKNRFKETWRTIQRNLLRCHPLVHRPAIHLRSKLDHVKLNLSLRWVLLCIAWNSRYFRNFSKTRILNAGWNDRLRLDGVGTMLKRIKDGRPYSERSHFSKSKEQSECEQSFTTNRCYLLHHDLITGISLLFLILWTII